MATAGSKREATFAAMRRLRDSHPDEFRTLHVEELRERGLPVPKTREERAREQAVKLLADYPQVVYEAVDESRKEQAGDGEPEPG